MNNAPELTHKLGLSIDEACQVIGIGRTKLYQALSQGKLVAKKAGRRTIITPAAAKTFVANLPAAVFSSGEADPDLAA